MAMVDISGLRGVVRWARGTGGRVVRSGAPERAVWVRVRRRWHGWCVEPCAASEGPFTAVIDARETLTLVGTATDIERRRLRLERSGGGRLLASFLDRSQSRASAIVARASAVQEAARGGRAVPAALALARLARAVVGPGLVGVCWTSPEGESVLVAARAGIPHPVHAPLPRWLLVGRPDARAQRVLPPLGARELMDCAAFVRGRATSLALMAAGAALAAERPGTFPAPLGPASEGRRGWQFATSLVAALLLVACTHSWWRAGRALALARTVNEERRTEIERMQWAQAGARATGHRGPRPTQSDGVHAERAIPLPEPAPVPDPVYQEVR